jgi:hypothetical protein
MCGDTSEANKNELVGRGGACGEGRVDSVEEHCHPAKMSGNGIQAQRRVWPLMWVKMGDKEMLGVCLVSTK